MTLAIPVGKKKQWDLWILLLLFFLIPIQKRFHGKIDSLSRKLTAPNFVFPDYFSTKIHLFLSDILIVLLTFTLIGYYRVSLRTFFWERSAKYATLLLLTALISTFFSKTGTYALSYFRWGELAISIVFFHIVRIVAQKYSLSYLTQKMAWVMVLGALFQCVISISQYFTQNELGLRFLGEKELWHFGISNPGHRWLFDHFFQAGIGKNYLCRVSGTFFHPNILGGFLFCSILCSLFLFVKQLDKWKKGLLFFCILLQIFTLSITFCRSAMAALFLSTLLFCIFHHKKSPKQLIKIFLLLGTCWIVCILLFYSQFVTRGGILNYNTHTTFADSERIQYMKIAFRMWKEHLLLGVGWNNFQLYVDAFKENMAGHFFASKVHNIYLLMTSQTGLIGGGLFTFFCLRLCFIFPFWENSVKILLFSLWLGLLFIGQCDFYLLENPEGSLLFFGIAGLLSVTQSDSKVGQKTGLKAAKFCPSQEA